MTNEQTIEALSRVTLTIPKHWPDSPAVKVPKGVLRIESTYVVSKKQYKVKIVFSTSNRDISGTGSTMFEAAKNLFKGPGFNPSGYRLSYFGNVEPFLA